MTSPGPQDQVRPQPVSNTQHPKPVAAQRLKLLGLGVGAFAMGTGTAIALLQQVDRFPSLPNLGSLTQPSIPEELDTEPQKPSSVLPLASLSPAERNTQLTEIAKANGSTLDKARANYLLAVDLIRQNRGGAALPLLDGLEKDYPVMAPYIMAKRAQAHSATGDSSQAIATWTGLLNAYPDDPVAADALNVLAQTQPDYQTELLAKFPAHPHAIKLVQQRLQQDPNQPALLLHLARHAPYLPGIDGTLSRLVNEYPAQLTPEDWEAIAFAYWELGYYGSAGYAYSKAPATSLNLYRAGRGAQLGERRLDAIAAYQKLVQTFPQGEETSLGLLRLAALIDPPEAAMPYLDQIIKQFPKDAGAALLERSKLLDTLKSPKSASQARESVLTQHSKSDAAAELRWSLAEQSFEAQDYQKALDLAQQIVKENPDSELAPEAAFWVGKWALALNKPEDARYAFEQVLSRFPDSYYAWRSAVYLGWAVGDFDTVRQNDPQVVKPSERPIPPAGSETLKELYRLGQDQDAWARWQVEYKTPIKSTVAEQFTDGLMRLSQGYNLDGIFMVSSLERRQTDAEKSEIQALKSQSTYWQALYPFPFVEPIKAWARQRQLNPLLVTGLIRQESRFEPKIVSSAGATGLMQVMPGTADWIATQMALAQYDLNKPDDNIKLGTWYLDYTHREYADNSLLAVASYNAGPGAVAGWVERFGTGDMDVFVEQIPYPETKGYVESVFANYWNYLRLYNPEISQALAQVSPAHAELIKGIRQQAVAPGE